MSEQSATGAATWGRQQQHHNTLDCCEMRRGGGACGVCEGLTTTATSQLDVALFLPPLAAKEFACD